MSCSYDATLVLGFRFERSELTKQAKVRGCNHPLVSGANFCGACGKPVWIETSERVEFQDAGGFEQIIHNTENFETAEEFDEHGSVIGLDLRASGKRPIALDKLDMPAIEAKLREELAKQGLVPISLFGMYLCKYVS